MSIADEDEVIPTVISRFIHKYPDRLVSFNHGSDPRTLVFQYLEADRETESESVSHTFATYDKAERCINCLFFCVDDAKRFEGGSRDYVDNHRSYLCKLASEAGECS